MPKGRQRVPQSAFVPDAPGLQKCRHQCFVAQRELRQWSALPGQHAGMVQRTAEDEPRHGVEVGSHGFAAEPHRLQGDRAAARERVENTWRAAAEGRLDLVSKRADACFRVPSVAGAALAPPVQNAALGGLLHSPATGVGGPLHHLSRHPAEHVPARLGSARIGQQGRQQRRPTGRQGTPRRPDVQRGNVAVTNALLVNRVQRDLLQREGGFDEAAVGQNGFLAPCLHQR